MTALSCTLTLKFMASGSGDIENPNNSTLDGEQQVMMRPNVPITQALPEGSDRQVLMNGVSGAVLRGPQDMDGETVAPSNSQRPLGVPDSVSFSGVPVDGRPAGSHQTEAARGFLLGPGQPAAAGSTVDLTPSTSTARRSPSFLTGMAKAVQSIPAAVEGLVSGQGFQAKASVAPPLMENEGYASAQSNTPDGERRSREAPAQGSTSPDERAFRRLNEMSSEAPLLYPPDPPSGGMRPPSTTSSDIQNEVRRQLQELMAARDEETKNLRLQVEILASENQQLQRDRAELSAQMYSREYGVRSESQSLFPGLGWLGRGFGSLINGGSPPKPPSPSRALDLRPFPPTVVAPARAPDASLGTSDPRPTAAASVLHQSSQVDHPPFQGELPPLATEGSLDVPAHSSSSVRPRVLDFDSVAAPVPPAELPREQTSPQATAPDPMNVVLTGMAQLQGVIADMASGNKSSTKAEVIKPGITTLPELPPAGPEACLAFSDWLHTTRPALADVSDSSEELWDKVLEESSTWYTRHLKLDAISRLTDRPVPSPAVTQARWTRVSRRIEGMILTAAPPGVRDEISSARVSGLLQVVCRLYVIYSPGGLSEREIGLRHIQEPSQGTSVKDTIEILRRWKRWCSRMVELGGALPDSSLQLKALEKITKLTLQAHPEVSFRISLTRASLQIDTCPDMGKVEQLHAQFLAELEALGHRLPKEDKPKDSRPVPNPKIKGVDAGDSSRLRPLGLRPTLSCQLPPRMPPPMMQPRLGEYRVRSTQGRTGAKREVIVVSFTTGPPSRKLKRHRGVVPVDPRITGLTSARQA